MGELQSNRGKIAERNNEPNNQLKWTISADNKDIAPPALIFAFSISAQIEWSMISGWTKNALKALMEKG